MFMMHFIHSILTNMFRADIAVIFRVMLLQEYECNKIHHKHCSAFCALLIYYGSV